jgi:hypothetical protein
MNRIVTADALALTLGAAAAPTCAADIPVLIHQRLKDGAARNKATLTFAERRVLVLGIGRRHASRKAKSRATAGSGLGAAGRTALNGLPRSPPLFRIDRRARLGAQYN